MPYCRRAPPAHTIPRPTRSAVAARRLKEIISNHYEIGELVAFRQLCSGYENTSFEIETVFHGEKNRYWLREYKAGTKEAEVVFQHSVINRLIERNFEPVARVIVARDGKSYVRQFEDEGEGDEGGEGNVFCALFDFLPGEDKYSWVNPACNVRELQDAAALLARLHSALSD